MVCHIPSNLAYYRSNLNLSFSYPKQVIPTLSSPFLPQLTFFFIWRILTIQDLSFSLKTNGIMVQKLPDETPDNGESEVWKGE